MQGSHFLEKAILGLDVCSHSRLTRAEYLVFISSKPGEFSVVTEGWYARRAEPIPPPGWIERVEFDGWGPNPKTSTPPLGRSVTFPDRPPDYISGPALLIIFIDNNLTVNSALNNPDRLLPRHFEANAIDLRRMPFAHAFAGSRRLTLQVLERRRRVGKYLLRRVDIVAVVSRSKQACYPVASIAVLCRRVARLRGDEECCAHQLFGSVGPAVSDVNDVRVRIARLEGCCHTGVPRAHRIAGVWRR